jgi:hypothetical protein
MGNVHLSPEAEAYFTKKGCTVLLQPTPKASVDRELHRRPHAEPNTVIDHRRPRTAITYDIAAARPVTL